MAMMGLINRKNNPLQIYLSVLVFGPIRDVDMLAVTIICAISSLTAASGSTVQ